ncbi:uncharacterized protein LOC142235497 [Haematobia irritans]|uniref:uncharacterized protein LOC142235497 n=1 Tax=Haematobia irritans TaxID=7368 RepID=UPI003F4FD082
MAEGPVALIGTMEVYNVREDFSLYINRLNHLLSLNKIVKDNDKTSLLISLGGAELYKTMCSLLAPKNESHFEYQQIVEILKNHFKPKKNIIVECFKFFKRDQHVGETIADYIVELKQLSQECHFESFLEKALIIKFVCGLSNDKIQTRILNEATIESFEKVCQMALSMELSNNDMELMRGPSTVNHISRSRDDNRESYGRKKRQEKIQRKSTIVCFYCKKRGHMEKYCWTKQKDEEEENRPKNLVNTRRESKYVKKCDYSSDCSEECDYLNNLFSCNYTSSLFVSVKIEDNIIDMEVDTGACVSIRHITYYDTYLNNIRLQRQEENLKVVTGDKVDVVGYVVVNVEYKGKIAEKAGS